ncbi:hypothetical protein [Geodermatophilus ruber]|uniref:Uncharacterized protein n=1 Tax=Geodermatophilus ruber TaxID=504800 RepID=A0A1I4BU68_9ACTN|nr:hypothetical protein [Geodermatophilus ruber]SFK72324.1 hypothetical protein SAMN04488085_103204 [Geodermatophilus ruber]
MLLLVVWIAVVVLAVVVLAALAHGLLGALQRLNRERQALDRELRPVLAEFRAAAARAAPPGDPAR